MRVLIDTNVLISAALGGGTPFQAYVKAASYPKPRADLRAECR